MFFQIHCFGTLTVLTCLLGLAHLPPVQVCLSALAPEDAMALLRRGLARQCARKDAAAAAARRRANLRPQTAAAALAAAASASSATHAAADAARASAPQPSTLPRRRPVVAADASPGLFAAVTKTQPNKTHT